MLYIMNFNKAVMHKVPTNDEIIRDTVIAPKDRIALPDRMATQLRNSPQLTRFDDESDLNLADDHDKISKERVRAIEVRNQAHTTNNYYNTTNVQKANEANAETTQPGQPPGGPPAGPPPPASRPQTNGAATQTHPKPSQTQASGSGDPYFGGRPPPAPSPPGDRPMASPFQDDMQQMLANEHHDVKAHFEEMKRMRDYSRKKLFDDINAEEAGRKRTPAEDMVDASMGTGRGPPPPPPGAAGYVSMQVESIDTRRKPRTFRMDSARGKRGGPRPGPKPDTPPYRSVNPIRETAQQQTPQQVYLGGSRVNKVKQKAFKTYKITITRGRRGKKTDNPDGADTPAPAPAPAPGPPPAPAPATAAAAQHSEPAARTRKKKPYMKPIPKPKDETKAYLGGLPNKTPEPKPIPPPPPPPVKKEKAIPHTTQTEKRKAAAEALAAAKVVADASTTLLPDDATAPKKQRATAPKPKVERITKPKAIGKAKPPGPAPAAVEVETTASKRGAGPDDQPNKKINQDMKTPGGSRKRGKPEEETIPAEEQRKPEIIIDPPSREELVALIQKAIKHDKVTPALVASFHKLGAQIPDDEDALSKAQQK
jgi:hypothetical protein